MNHEAAIRFAEQRMRELGKNPEAYHYSPLVVVATQEELEKGEIIIKAYNEYFYLINYENQTGIEILSDTGYFNSDDFSNNTSQEFSGLIRIKFIGFAPPSKSQAAAVPARRQIVISDKSSTAILKIKPIEFLRVTFH